MRDRHRYYTRTASHSRSRSRGRGGQSPTSSTIDDTPSPKHTRWFQQTYDDYDNDTRCTEDTFDCRDSQLSLSIPRVNTEATGLTGYSGYSGYTGYTDLTGYTDQTGLTATSGYTGDYTADTFRSNAAAERNALNANANVNSNRIAIDKLLVDAAKPSKRREGFTNQSVVLTALPAEAAENGAETGDNTTSGGSSNHPRDVDLLEVQSQFIEHKTRDELKPFAIVEVEASTVSTMDTMIRRDRFQRSPKNRPYRMGCDMIGKVVRAGRGSQTFGIAEGDRVCAMDFHLGGQSKYVVVPCYDLIPVPPSVGDSTHAVCALRAYVMAYQCLYHVGEDRPLLEGDRVLVVGGTGAIGQAVVELALEGGARFVYATGTGNKVSRLLRSKGVRILDRDPAKWLPDVEGNMDIVVDLVGLDGYAASIKAAKGDATGKVVCAGTLNGQNQISIGNLVVNAAANLVKNVSTYDFFASIENDPGGYKEDLRQVFRLLKHKKISPRISKFVLLNEVPSAHEAIEAGGLDGHVICRPNPTKKFVYNAKETTNDEEDEETVDTRDDTMSFMLDERSNASNDHQSEYSRSVISKVASGESEFTDFTGGTYSTYGDASSYNTFGLFSGTKKKADSEGAKGSTLLGGISALAAIGENVASWSPAKSDLVDNSSEVETQVGSIQTTQDAGKRTENEQLISTSVATELQTAPVMQKDIPASVPELSPVDTKTWLKRMPSFSKKKNPTGLQATNLHEDQPVDSSPIASETVIKVPSPRNIENVGESSAATSREENVGQIIETAVDEGSRPTGDNCSPTPQNDDEDTGPIELFSCVTCLCSTASTKGDPDEYSIVEDNIIQLQDTELPKATGGTDKISPEIAKEENETSNSANALTGNIQSDLNQARSLFAKKVPQDNESSDPYISDEQKQDKAEVANGDVCSALNDLFGLGLCSQASPARKESERPAQITIQPNQGDEPSALEVDLGIVATLSNASDGSSTFVASGMVLEKPNRQSMTPPTALPPVSDLPKIQRMPISDELSALTGATKPMLSSPEKKGIPLKLPNFGRQRSMSRAKGLVKSLPPIPLGRSQSARSYQKGTPNSCVSTARTNTSSSAVSIRCGQNSNRLFHVPSTVASSAMTVASSRSTSSKRSRNIYARSNGRQQRGGTVQRLPPGGNKGRSNFKSIFDKKK